MKRHLGKTLHLENQQRFGWRMEIEDFRLSYSMCEEYIIWVSVASRKQTKKWRMRIEILNAKSSISKATNLQVLGN